MPLASNSPVIFRIGSVSPAGLPGPAVYGTVANLVSGTTADSSTQIWTGRRFSNITAIVDTLQAVPNKQWATNMGTSMVAGGMDSETLVLVNGVKTPLATAVNVDVGYLPGEITSTMANVGYSKGIAIKQGSAYAYPDAIAKRIDLEDADGVIWSGGFLVADEA